MERLESKTELAPLHHLVVLRPLLPRGRLHLRQIKREPIVEVRVNVARKGNAKGQTGRALKREEREEM